MLMSVYNCEDYIVQTVKSIQRQSLKDFEAIIVDDGSADKTYEVICKIVLNDKRFKIFKKTNSGLADSLNFGLRQCSSDIVVRHDAEDISHPKRFEILYNYLTNNPEVDCVVSENFIINEFYRPLAYYPVKRSKDLNNDLDVGKGKIAHPSVAYRKSSVLQVGGYPLIDACEDLALWKQMRKANKNFKYINIPVYAFMVTGKGISISKMEIQTINTFKINNVSITESELKDLIEARKYYDWLICGVNPGKKLSRMSWNFFYQSLAKLVYRYKIMNNSRWLNGILESINIY